MKEDQTLRLSRIKAEKRANGLLYGLLAGLIFSLVLWGIDGYLLLQANMDYPWLKFLAGVPFCMLVGGLAGWLTARLDNALLGFLIWLLAGLVYVWVASHVPFEGLSKMVGYIDPTFRDLNIYPFVESARMRMSLLYLAVGLLTGLAGGLELFVVESATRASFLSGRWFVLFLGALAFGVVALLVDNLINQPLREPILVIHQVIQNSLQAEQTPVTKEQAREMGLRAVKPFGDLIHRPYRLYLGHYDPESMSETTVSVDFGGNWGTCFVLHGTPTFCQLSVERYGSRFACLLRGGKEKDCQMKVLPEARPDFEQVAQEIGAPSAFGIMSQWGNAVVLIAEGEAGQEYQCLLRVPGDIWYESCVPLDGQVAAWAKMATPKPWLRATPTASALPSETMVPATPTPAPDGSQYSDPPATPRYTMELVIDYDAHTFQARARVDYTNAEDVPLDRLYFRLMPNGQHTYGNGSLTVTEALVDGQPANLKLSLGDTVLEIELPRSLEVGNSLQIEFEFNGDVPRDFGGNAAPVGYGIYNISDGVLALSGWYPILAVYDDQGWNLDPVSEIGDSVYSDTASYTVVVTVPSDLVVAATGSEIDRQVSNGQARLRYESGPARDFFLAASPDFQVASRMQDGTKINSYYLPGHEAGGSKALAVAVDSLAVFNEKFGPYPYPEMDVVEAPMRNALGVEYPGIFLVGADLYDDPGRPEFTVTTAHEVSHQWWYNVIGNDVFDEPWLDEALATYSSSLYYEFVTGGEEGFIEYWQDRYDRLVQEGSDDLVTQSLAHFENLSDSGAYGGVVYTKGALFFRALRQEIGDKAFFAALQDYYQIYQYQIATGEDLLGAFERAAGRQLDDFFQQWLYSKGVP